MAQTYVRFARKSWLLLFALVAVLALVAMPAYAYADEGSGTRVEVANMNAAPGDTVDVAVAVKNNPGILGAVLKVSYGDGLTLVKASSGDALSYLTMTRPGSLSSPCKFTWDGVDVDSDSAKDGDMLVLTFEVADSVEVGSSIDVEVSGDAGAFLDANLDPIDVTYASGTVTVSDFIAGDVDSDTIVNSRDVIFTRRHIVGGYDQRIKVAAADVNNSHSVDSADVILMRRFITGGYGVQLKHSTMNGVVDFGEDHSHELEAIAATSPTCVEDGNIAYWRCGSCGRYFSDAAGQHEIQLSDTVIEAIGHTPVIDPAIAPTHTATGLTEGSHCSVCGETIKAQTVVPALDADEFFITYDVSNGDPYLASQEISNPNKTSYFEGDSFRLTNLSVDGYRFLGWYDGAGDDAAKVTRVDAGTAEDLQLYAHWQVVPYTVQYESDLFLDTDSSTYTVDKGLVLPTPKLSNYVFAGWTDSEGNLYGKKIPAGTTGNITLSANWTSERNKTYTNPKPADPIIYEDEDSNVILFAYEIGRIENVPLYTIKDFGYISGDGVTRSATETYTAQTSQSTAETLSNVVANATTNSSNWTLSSGWNESTSISEEWCKQNGYTREEAETVARSDSKNWNVSNSSYGSRDVTNSSSSSDGWSNQVKIDRRESHTDTHTDETAWKVSGELNAGINGGKKASVGVPVEGLNLGAEKSFGWNVGLKVGGEYGKTTTDTSTNTMEHGLEIGGTKTHSGTDSSSITNTSGWNSSASYGGSSTTSRSNTVSTAVSEQISQKTGYGKTYARSGNESQGLATSDTTSQTDSYTSATTYNTASSESVSSSWTTAATKPGYHRWVVAGTAHVFGVVGYDIESKSFFVYTYSIMDDATHEFEDYSYTTAAYNDNENGVISFEVPYDEVMNTVADRVYASDGLKVDLETGTVVQYTGSDTCVVIPEYYNAGNGDVVRITGIAPGTFAGNTDIVTVILSDYITEIPDGAFAGCTSLAFVDGTGVMSIGARAFAGCSSMEDCGVYSKVTHLGASAFEGAEHLYVNAANADVAQAAIVSGAKNVTLNLGLVSGDEDSLSGCTLNVPASVEYFELNGDFRTFNGLKITSDAAETSLNKVTIAGDSSLPVKISSGKVTLNQANISSPGIALALTADSTEIGLRGTSVIRSTTANAAVSKNMTLYETANDVVGKLVIPQKLLVCGNVDGTRYLQCGSIESIDADTFDKLMNSYYLRFDAGEGTCDVSSREIVYGVTIGELPIPVRNHCTFDGWYLKGSDTLITESTVLPFGQNETAEARWIEHWITDIPDGVYSFAAASNSSYVLDCPGGETGTAGEWVHLWSNCGIFNQRFKLSKNDDGTYRIGKLRGDLVWAAGENNTNGKPCIELRGYSGANLQKWYIEKSENGKYLLRNKANDLYIEVTDGFADGNLVQCAARNASSNQEFEIANEIFAMNDYKCSYAEAMGICEQVGGHLAVITSDLEQKALEDLFNKRVTTPLGSYWLGGYKEGSTWKWVTGEPFTYTHWAVGEPSNSQGIEDKLVLWSNHPDFGERTRLQWNDGGDTGGYVTGFVCEWEDSSLSAASTSDTSLTVADSALLGE